MTVQGSGIRVSGFGLQVHADEVRGEDNGPRFRVPVFGFPVSAFRMRVSGY